MFESHVADSVLSQSVAISTMIVLISATDDETEQSLVEVGAGDTGGFEKQIAGALILRSATREA